MTNNNAIVIENLSKHYRLGEGGDTDSLREMISETGSRMLRRLRGVQTDTNVTRDFWALQDINVQIKRGDVVGIIGHNGAGKSTLLKILSRITDPTTGKADIWGRVGSLLEVGTGFHPELTGRENIYLNGAILGMTTGEIKSRFDEIVEFAEVAQFLETPVKRYSSGMYVRLAFAVAAHLQPEVLIVDEVLAVGDMKFQKKCLGKMKDVANNGRTVLFVSHNMGAVQSMCTRGLLLDHGRLIADTTAQEAVSLYVRHMEEKSLVELKDRTDRKGDGQITVHSLIATSNADKPANSVATGEKVTFEIGVTGVREEMNCILVFVDHHGQHVMVLRYNPTGDHDRIMPELGNRLLCEVENFPLAAGEYTINIELWSQRYNHDSVVAATTLTVIDGHIGGRLLRQPVRGACVMPVHQWMVPR